MTIFQRIRAYSPGPAVYLFASVFLIRSLILARLTASPLLLPARGDMYFYNDWAQRILRGTFTDHHAFYGLPGYAYLLAFLYKIFGYSPFVPAFLQALLEGGTAVLIYQISRRVLPAQSIPSPQGRKLSAWVSAHPGEVVGWAAALGWAFFVPAQAFAVILMPTAWLIFVFWLVVWWVVRADGELGPKAGLLLGLLLGLTATVVATILFLVPLVVAAMFLRRKNENPHSGRRLAFGLALLLFGLAAGTSPAWIHNYFVARDPVLLSAHSGINFWIGNNPEANGYPRFPPGLRAGQAAMLEDSIARAEEAAGHSLRRAEVSSFWSAKAKDYIASHPAEWMRLLLLKLRNFWSAFQYDDLSIVTILREQRVILPGLYFGMVAALAVPGILLAWRRAPPSRWVTAAILLHLAALLPVFVTERYRLPIVPGLLIFAAFGLYTCWQSIVSGQYGQMTLYLLLVVAATLFVSWPQRSPSLWALDAYNSGWQALEAGNLAAAEKKLSLAHAYVPTNPETNFALGNLKLAQGDPAQAKARYRQTLSLDQRHKGALNNLAVIAGREEEWTSAETYLRTALTIEPCDSKTHYLLAQALLAQGRSSEARPEIERALALRPGQSEFVELQQQIEATPSPPTP